MSGKTKNNKPNDIIITKINSKLIVIGPYETKRNNDTTLHKILSKIVATKSIDL